MVRRRPSGGATARSTGKSRDRRHFPRIRCSDGIEAAACLRHDAIPAALGCHHSRSDRRADVENDPARTQPQTADGKDQGSSHVQGGHRPDISRVQAMVGAAARSPENRFGRTRQNGSHGWRLCRHSPSHPDVSHLFRTYTVRGDRRTCESVTPIVAILSPNPTMIRAARPDEIALLPQIENAADERYVRVGLRRVLDMPPASVASLEQGRRRGMLWVATSPLNRVVGFALMKLPAGTAWLDQLSVLDRWQGRGLGRGADRSHRPAGSGARPRHALSLDLSRRAVERAILPTSRFLAGAARKWPRAFRAQFMIENSHGHPPWRRTIMQRRV